MKIKAIPIFLLLLLFASVVHSETRIFPRLNVIFSAKEVKKDVESKAYTFEIYCGTELFEKEAYCTLGMTLYDECQTINKHTSFNVYSYQYSTKDNSLSVKSINEQFIELQFSKKDIAHNNYKLSIFFAKHGLMNGLLNELKSVEGSIERKYILSGQNEYIPIRAISAPGEKLIRSCSIYLHTN